ncbi:hypothetical protein C8A05DRAFT_40105 [Staphylotrichum tortipilum]|uniref:Uncharacterized protein n=1 Tax=Staphylotrichum tortipilum TaxID=2831512 RepID=A0AAN6M9B3_9PEZI|nr:hypothetical protein C8A05DRAFT_40105 [Staphylotrichum longicolle]
MGGNPPSLRSKTSETTLATTTATQVPEPDNKEPPCYLYHERVGPGNPDGQEKPKSKLAKFISTLQSPAAQQTNAARDRELLKEERTGVRTLSATGAVAGSGQATAA